MDVTQLRDDGDGETLLAALRRETRPLHDRVDALAALDPVTPAAYERFLSAMLAAHRPLSSVLDNADQIAWLEADLRALGQDPDDVPAALDPPPRWLTDSSRLGAAYVIEGSALGGRALLPGVVATLGDAATRFITGRGEATGARWRDVRARLERERAADHTGAIAAARDVFARFEHALREVSARAGRAGS